MILYDERGNIGVSFFYPLIGRKRACVRVIDWRRYKKLLPFFITMNLSLLLCGIVLMADAYYSDSVFNVYALLINLYGAFRCIFVRTKTNIRIEKCKQVNGLPVLAVIDWSCFYLSLAVMSMIAIKTTNMEANLMAIFSLSIIVFVALSLIPVINSALGRMKAMQVCNPQSAERD